MLLSRKFEYCKFIILHAYIWETLRNKEFHFVLFYLKALLFIEILECLLFYEYCFSIYLLKEVSPEYILKNWTLFLKGFIRVQNLCIIPKGYTPNSCMYWIAVKPDKLSRAWGKTLGTRGCKFFIDHEISQQHLFLDLSNLRLLTSYSLIVYCKNIIAANAYILMCTVQWTEFTINSSTQNVENQVTALSLSPKGSQEDRHSVYVRISINTHSISMTYKHESYLVHLVK